MCPPPPSAAVSTGAGRPPNATHGFILGTRLWRFHFFAEKAEDAELWVLSLRRAVESDKENARKYGAALLSPDQLRRASSWTSASDQGQERVLGGTVQHVRTTSMRLL